MTNHCLQVSAVLIASYHGCAIVGIDAFLLIFVWICLILKQFADSYRLCKPIAFFCLARRQTRPDNRCTIGRITMKLTRGVLGHSLLCSLVRSHRSLICLLRPARFARALRCAHSLARLLTPELLGKQFMSMNRMRRFHAVSTHYAVDVVVLLLQVAIIVILEHLAVCTLIVVVVVVLAAVVNCLIVGLFLLWLLLETQMDATTSFIPGQQSKEDTG